MDEKEFQNELGRRNASYRQDGTDHIIKGNYEGMTITGSGKTIISEFNAYDAEIAGKKQTVREVCAILAGRGEFVNGVLRQ